MQTLQIVGELTIQTAAERKNALMAMVEAVVETGSSGDIDMDLTGVTELDTAGLQILLLAKREADRLGGRLRLLGDNRVVADVLSIARLDALLDNDAEETPGRTEPVRGRAEPAVKADLAADPAAVSGEPSR